MAFVLRRIHRAVGDADIPAAVDVETVAVGVDLDVADGQVVDAGGEENEPAALKHREVFQVHISGKVPAQWNLLPSPAWFRRRAEGRVPRSCRFRDGNVLEVLAPDQAVCQWL